MKLAKLKDVKLKKDGGLVISIDGWTDHVSKLMKIRQILLNEDSDFVETHEVDLARHGAYVEINRKSGNMVINGKKVRLTRLNP
jgi:hypothetical protein